MDLSEDTLLLLASILFFGLIVPQFFRKIRISFVASVIIIGAAFGPFGLNYIQTDETIKLFGFLGATFHMLLAGFEAETLHLKDMSRNVWKLIGLSLFIPLISGIAIVRWFEYSWETSFFMGFVFVSTSVMIVFSDVENLDIKQTRLGKTLQSLAVVQDLTSSLLIFLIFKYIQPHIRFSLPILLGLVLSSIIILRMFLPEVASYFFQRFEKAKDQYESKLRLVLVLLFVVLIAYSSLDVHPVIAAFLVGFTLSGIPKSIELKEKLSTIGYAMFIPVYLFIIGMELDLSLFRQFSLKNYLLITVILTLVFSKLISGIIGGRISGFSFKEALVIGISSSTKLTVAISSAYAALALELIDNYLYTAIVTVSVLTTILGPILLALLVKKKNLKDHA